MASKELFSQLSLWMVNILYVINLTVYISPYIYMCPQSSWIRIQYGSNTDPIRIRINKAWKKAADSSIFLNL